MVNEGSLTWVKFKIAEHQLEVQERALTALLTRIEISLNPYSNKETWKLYDFMRELKRETTGSLRDLRNLEIKKATWFGKLKLKLYLWSVKDRFDKESVGF